ncbi:MAG: hypoxanthine phosphoribosyltransferase [Deltaproteobacteria bacterium]|nr:hypoxanthine phosphoribosyltransferase [Deltaproteobacteria bacterium]
MATATETIDPYLGAAQIAARIAELGRTISEVGAGPAPLVVVCVLKGSFMFFADLVRHIDLPTNLVFLGVSSYGGATESSGAVRLTHDLTLDIRDRDVLIVEDIVDTGLTMSYLLDILRARGPRSLRVCTLLHKPARKRIDVQLDHVGFTIDDVFVVGYGLDYDERYRNVPYIGVMRFG